MATEKYKLHQLDNGEELECWELKDDQALEVGREGRGEQCEALRRF